MVLAQMSSSSWPNKIWSLALLFRLLAGCATTEAPETELGTAQIDGDVEQFGQWFVGCNNLGTCSAIAPLREYAAGQEPAHIRFLFGSDFRKPPVIAIIRDGKLVETVSAQAAQPLTDGLRNGVGDDVMFVSEIGTRFDVPRGGFLVAMEALAARRARPPQQANPTDFIFPIPATRMENLGDPPAVASIAKHCPNSHIGTPLKAWKLMGGGALWHADCGNEGLNSVSFWMVSGPQGAPAELIRFEDGDSRVDAYNSWFDDSSGFLRMIHYFGHWESYAEDCGIYRAYAVGFGKTRLVEKRLMPQCGTGLSPNDWIITYRAPVLNGRDSGP
jgi:hypothetical protein